jgi:galactonate dehydratase
MSNDPKPNDPAPIGTTTTSTTISQQQATYLPPSELALKYAKGIHAGTDRQNLIKRIESFYVRPRWLFVRVRSHLRSTLQVEGCRGS